MAKWSKGTHGVSMGGRIEHTRRKPKKEYCKGCKHCSYSANGTQMFCKKHKRFSSVWKTSERKCYVR